MEKKILIVFLMAFMAVGFVHADKYKVLYVNSPNIRIGSKKIAIGSVFDDKDKIEWSNDQQAIKVLNLNSKRVFVLAAKAIKKKKASSLYEYLTSTKHLSTRNIRNKKTMEIWQIDSTLYLLDSLYISRPYSESKDVIAKIVSDEGTEIELPISQDRQSYVITRSMFANQQSPSNKYNIIEIDKNRNWKYVVYRKLIIETVLSEMR
ncbi:MAG: hypothetical protein J6N71_04335 [Muribaculaceae bacterium]|nr:hypothetical protein [Muribaculaceae bacterium]